MALVVMFFGWNSPQVLTVLLATSLPLSGPIFCGFASQKDNTHNITFCLTLCQVIILLLQMIAQGKHKILDECTLPLTGKNVVDLIVTEMVGEMYSCGPAT